MPANLVEMGRLGKALGLKGEIYLVWHGDSPPQAGQDLYLKDSQGGFKKTVLEALRFQKGRPVALLENVKDRTEAEGLTGAAVFQAREDLEPCGEDEVFLADILGCRIFLSDGTPAGVLERVDFPANQPVWVIKGENGKEILFPGQPCFIEGFYPEERKIVISPPPGLMEIYDA